MNSSATHFETKSFLSTPPVSLKYNHTHINCPLTDTNYRYATNIKSTFKSSNNYCNIILLNISLNKNIIIAFYRIYLTNENEYSKLIYNLIKWSESYAGNIQFWFVNIYYFSIRNVTFWSTPHHYWKSGCRDLNKSCNFLNNVKHKEFIISLSL